MQAGKNAMQSTKEAAANVGASARAGMDKSRAAVQGQVEKATARNAADKDAAEVRRQERVQAAEEEKQHAMAANAAARARHGRRRRVPPSQGAPGGPACAQPTEGTSRTASPRAGRSGRPPARRGPAPPTTRTSAATSRRPTAPAASTSDLILISM